MSAHAGNNSAGASSEEVPPGAAKYRRKKACGMKKLIALLLTALLLGTAAAASAGDVLDGGWQVAEDTAITEERQELFDRALNGLLGVSYVPVAYLGSQVVAGMNHCFLCQATVVYPGAQTRLVLVYLYEDLTGHAEITRIADLDIAALSVAAE